MEDLENIKTGSNREDSTGGREQQPAYKAFTKDRRPSTEAAGGGQKEYVRREYNNGGNKPYNSDNSERRSDGNRDGGYNRSYGNREGGYKRPEGNSYNREGGYKRPEGSNYNREGGSGNNSEGGEKRQYSSNYNNENRRSNSSDNRGGGYNSSRNTTEGGYNRSANGYKRPEGSSYNREGGYIRPEGGNNSEGYKRPEGGSYNREGGYKRPEGGSYNREGGNNNRQGGYRSENNSEGSTRRSFNPNFDLSNRPVNRDNSVDGNREGGNRPYNKEFNRRDSSERSNTYGDRKPRTYGNDASVEKRPWQDRSEGNRPYSSNGYGAKQDRPYGNSGSYEKRGDRPSAGRWQTDDRQQGGRGRADRNSAPRYNQDNYPTFPAPVIDDKIRLNRYISMSGICSRREADEFIQSGMVTVNGLSITELGAKVAQTDEIRFNGNLIENEKKVYIVMNKPKGFVTSIEDPHADKTVMDLLKNGCRERVYPVGRLDKNSLGVLLITNDGDLAKKLTHPSFEKKKVYQVSLDRSFTNTDMDSLVAGFELEDGEIHADAASYVGEKKTEVGVEIHSGRNRIVRRMFEHLGYKVTKLDRVYFAGMTKQRLRRGEWRFLSPREVQALQSGQYE